MIISKDYFGILFVSVHSGIEHLRPPLRYLNYLIAEPDAFHHTIYLIDIGITCEHLVLEAEDLGFGTCWIAWFNENAVKSVLNIPRDKKVDILIALGYYSKDSLGSEHGREPMDKIASFNSY